jgi:signal transduction histidine kinase
MTLFYSFLNNIFAMLAVAIIHGFIIKRFKDKSILARFFSGIIFSFAVLAIMSNKFVLSPGVVFDARSAVISICGMFAGPVAVSITSTTAIIHRIHTGGGGRTMGILVIISSALIGLLFYYLRKTKPQLTKPLWLYIFGFIVHINMLFWAITLPRDLIIKAYQTITLPVLVILPLGTFCFGMLLRDQEKQLETEQALQKAHVELETKVLERTEQLSRANVRLQELDKLKSMFIASMSHELRTPLNSIIGFTGIIIGGMSGEITDEQKKQLGMVKSSASHLLELINDVIDVSKIEADKVSLSIEEFDLTALVQDVYKSFETIADEHGLKITFEPSEKLIISSDKRRTKQVVINLVSNAIKFTDNGRIDIKLAKTETCVEVSVVDTGIGIKKEDIGRLFQAFGRIATENRLTEGSGLGLYLSKKIACLLGGDIRAVSEPGKGSVFTLAIPLKYRKPDSEPA